MTAGKPIESAATALVLPTERFRNKLANGGKDRQSGIDRFEGRPVEHMNEAAAADLTLMLAPCRLEE